MQFQINGEQADALWSVLSEQAARADDDGIGPMLFTKQGMGEVVVAFPSDGRTFEITAGGTVEEI